MLFPGCFKSQADAQQCLPHQVSHSTQNKHWRTRYKCPKCNEGLCGDSCFRVHHTKLQF